MNSGRQRLSAFLRRAALTFAVLSRIPAVAGPIPQDQAYSTLDLALQAGLAERFAPVLVYHPAEEYYPTSPLFPLEGRSTRTESPMALLGTAESRREAYRALTLEEKAELATVYYRAYPARHDAEDVVVLEYWLYYVQNTYRVRGNILPIWTDGSHPNDLEHIHIVLRGSEAAGLTLDEVYASSHEGRIPANRYRYPEDAVEEPGQFIIELGSHAIAPDIDRDGVYTPGHDGSSGYKMLWGIRDNGITWTRYDRSYMDARVGPDATILAHGSTRTKGQLSYQLVPVEALRQEFEELRLTDTERERIFETDRHWFRRAFGGDNGSSEKLLVPPVPDPRGDSIGIEGYSATERGFLAGGTFNLDEPGLFLGARYGYLHGIKYLPDVIIEADGIVTQKTGYFSTQFLLTYPIDSTTKLMGGRVFVTDSIRFDRRQWDWIGAIELRLGHMRVYAASRSWGPITQSAKEFRVSYFF